VNEKIRIVFFILYTSNIYIFLIKYAESMQKVCSAKALLCLTLSTYLVLQQLSLFQTARPYFTKCIKTLNIFVETFYSPDIFGFGCGLIGFRGRRARHEEMYVVQLVCPLVFLSFPIFFTVVSERFAIHLS
jgi:hypothetical protein